VGGLSRLVRSWFTGPWAKSWTIVFVANLIVPLFFGLAETRYAGQFGMFCAVAVFWLLGLLASAWSDSVARVLLAGGSLVGFSQFVLVLHIYIGEAALHFWLGHDRWQMSEWDGFVVTALTGGALLAIAGVFGIALVALSALVHSPGRSS
jgi:hypothetical protein